MIYMASISVGIFHANKGVPKILSRKNTESNFPVFLILEVYFENQSNQQFSKNYVKIRDLYFTQF